jgi:hypothetical protein
VWPAKVKPILTVQRDISIARDSKYHKNYLVALLCLLATVAPYSHATAVVVVGEKGTVWMAVDSQETKFGSDHTVATRFKCKLIDEGTFYWGAASAFYENPDIGYSVKDLVDQIRDTKGTLTAKMQTLIANTQVPFAKDLAYIKATSPAGYAELVAGGATVFNIVFVGVQSGHVDAVWAHVEARILPMGKVVVTGTTKEENLSARDDYIAIGLSAEALSYIAANMRLIAPATLLRKAISIEDDSEPQPKTVGGKISVLRVTSQGGTWIDKGECK